MDVSKIPWGDPQWIIDNILAEGLPGSLEQEAKELEKVYHLTVALDQGLIPSRPRSLGHPLPRRSRPSSNPRCLRRPRCRT